MSVLSGGSRLASLVPKGARALIAKSFQDPALAGATGLFLADEAVEPIVEGAFERGKGYAGDGPAIQDIRARRLMEAKRERASRLKGAIEENIVRIAATDPHLYNQLLHGRRLPKGAVVIGRKPRTDFIEEVAFGMATGQIKGPDQKPDILKSLME